MTGRIRKLRFLCLLAALLLFLMPLSALAEEAEEAAPEPQPPADSYLTDNLPGWPVGPPITPAAGILVDMDTGAILYGKNIHDPHYPASITKIMTSLVAIERGTPEMDVVFSHDAVYNIERGSANVGMKEGEVISLDQALRCLMSASANECAYAIAENVGGDFGTFIQWMNDKAKELGCTDSHFMNPHGLHDPDHYVSAHDMALIATAAYKTDWFRDICCLRTYNRPITAMNPTDAWVITNRHQMLRPETPYYYEWATGGKTGFTNEAMSTLVTFAEHDGMRLCTVVLRGAGVEVYAATKALLDFGFSNFSHKTAAECLGPSVIQAEGAGSLVTVPNGIDVSELRCVKTLESGNLGSVSFSYGTNSLGSCKVTFAEEYVNEQKPKEEPKQEEEEKVVQEEEEPEVPEKRGSLLTRITSDPKVFLAAMGGVIVLIAAVIILTLRTRRRKRTRAKAEAEKSRRKEGGV